MTHRTFRTSRLVAGTALLALTTICGPLAMAAPPALDAPLIHNVTPWEAQQGQQVMIGGVNFGNAPEVRFSGNLATIVTYRPDVGRIIVTVPGGDTDGPLIVTNTDTGVASNAAQFTLLADPYPQACTIDGVVTNPSGGPLADAVAVALAPGTGTFFGADVSAAITGTYSIDLPAAGVYDLLFVPPEGAGYHEQRYAATCSGTQNHQFAVGLELTGRVVSDAPAPIVNAWVGAEGSGDFGTETLTDTNGDFFLHVPPDSYNVDVVGPVGGRHIWIQVGPVVVSGSTDLGDITLDTGVLVSGELRWQDGLDSGPLGGAFVAAFDTGGQTTGVTSSIADGSFHLPTATGSDLQLFVSPDVFGLVDLAVRSIDIIGDTQLDHPFTVYSWAAQLAGIPTIVESERLTVQEGQRLIFDAAQMRGTSIEVFFSDGLGGQVNGDNTVVEQDRGGLVTTVPAAADTGQVVIRVDGVDSPGYPLTVDPGIYSPGSYTTSGVVDDGSIAVENAFVGIFEIGCNEEYLVDYDLTDPSGAYSVRHGGGDFAIFVLPPIPTGLARSMAPLFGTTGGGTQNFTLTDGLVVAARCVDSGDGPVGSSDPLPDCEVDTQGIDIDYEDSVYSDGDGNFTLNLPAGTYEATLRPPFRSRYFSGDSSLIPITGDVDLGDATMDSGYFIEGRIVDQAGDGLAGVVVVAFESSLGMEMAETRTVGPDGSFRLGVLPGIYHLFPSVHADQEHWVAPVFNVYVGQDLLLYPDLQAEPAGHIRGTVVDGSAIPIEEMPVAAYHDVLGFVRQTDSCPDGSYDLKVPDGNYVVQARPSFDGLCLADEYYDDHYEGCGADLVSLTVPGTATGIDFALEPAGSITGSVIGATGPLPDVAVCATDGLTNPTCHHACTTTGFDGTYVLSNLPVAADYRVDAIGPGQPWECWDGQPDCIDYDPVPVGECVVTPGIQFHALAAPGPVPDGAQVSGTLMSVHRGVSAGEIVIDWQPTCDADDHAIYFGPLGDFSTYTFAVCNAGMAGTFSVTPPGGDLFWVVVGQNGSLEGTYGYRSDLSERPGAGGTWCGNIQDLTATCLP